MASPKLSRCSSGGKKFRSASSTIPLLEACRKRKRSPKMFAFHAFACDRTLTFSGAFRDNIRAYLNQCAVHVGVGAKPTWSTLLVHHPDDRVVPLYTVEESVAHSQTSAFCDLCRVSGWSNHFVSKRRYHIIIPADSKFNKPLDEDALEDQTHQLHGLLHCNGFGHLICINGREAGSKLLCGREIMDLWDRICSILQVRKVAVEDVSKKRGMDIRLLHGVAYGYSWFGRWGYKFYRGSFGVTVNNYNNAIELLSSIELDKIINDFSENSIIKQIISHYRYVSDTQLVTIRDLLRFMLTLKSLSPLAKMRSPAFGLATCSRHSRSLPPKESGSATGSRHSAGQSQSLPAKVSARTGLASCSRNSARNEYATGVEYAVKAKSDKTKTFSTFAKMDSRWPARRLQFAAEVVVDVLKEKKECTKNKNGGGMTRQELRDVVRMHIGDTGLLDYVLKSMNNVIIGNYVVNRAVNPETRILEYSIQEISNSAEKQTKEVCGDDRGKDDIDISETQIPVAAPAPAPAPASASAPGFDVYSDVLILYTHVLLDYPGSETLKLASQAVSHSKIFVKEWPVKDDGDQLLRFICQVKASLAELEEASLRRLPPGELIVIPLYGTVGDLKLAAQNAIRDTYCALEQFLVTDIQGMENLSDEDILFGAIESCSQILIEGDGIDLATDLTYEGGPDNWKVKCKCGAVDDDGERMIACDMCEVWQHTCCLGIDDTESVPPRFLCHECSSPLLMPTNEFISDFEHPYDMLLPGSELQDEWQVEEHHSIAQ